MTTLTIWLLIGIVVYLALYIKKRRTEPENTKVYQRLPLIARIIGAVIFIIFWPLALLELLSGGNDHGN